MREREKRKDHFPHLRLSLAWWVAADLARGRWGGPRDRWGRVVAAHAWGWMRRWERGRVVAACTWGWMRRWEGGRVFGGGGAPIEFNSNSEGTSALPEKALAALLHIVMADCLTGGQETAQRKMLG